MFVVIPSSSSSIFTLENSSSSIIPTALLGAISVCYEAFGLLISLTSFMLIYDIALSMKLAMTVGGLTVKELAKGPTFSP